MHNDISENLNYLVTTQYLDQPTSQDLKGSIL